MVKVVLLLLVFLAILGVFGRLRYPARGFRRPGAARCPACGRPRVGNGPCPCGGKA
ncbi:hypothetical protein [Albidovulum sp.]|uniref:hypothetical protein n=1 Tax=Albidovulum sp. TaxID=1872424 RepID=UPI0039B83EFD